MAKLLNRKGYSRFPMLVFGIFLISVLLIVASMVASSAATTLNTGIDGLSASSSTSSGWKMSNGNIVGSVTSSKSCNTDTTSTATLEMTNTSNETRTLTFTYTEDNLGTAKFSGALTDKPQSGSTVSVVLNSGQKLTIELVSNSKNTKATTVTLSNISFKGAENVTATFMEPTHGTYTVDGENVTSQTIKEKKTTEVYSIAASPDTNYSFTGWYINGALYSTDATISALSIITNSTVEARFDVDPLAQITTLGAVSDPSLTKYDLAEYTSTYEPEFELAVTVDEEHETGRNYSAAYSSDVKNDASKIGSFEGESNNYDDNYWPNKNLPNVNWTVTNESTITASRNSTAYGDNAASIFGMWGNTAGAAKTNAKVLRIKAKETIKVSFNYTVTMDYDTAGAETGNWKEIAFFYPYLTNSSEPPTLAQLKSGTPKGGNEKNNSGESSYTGTFRETIPEGYSLYLYFYGFGYTYRSGKNGCSFDYSFNSTVSNLVIRQANGIFDFQSGCIDGAGNMIGSGKVSINNTPYSVNNNGLTEELTGILDGRDINLSVTTVPTGYKHIGWRVVESESNFSDVFKSTYDFNIESDSKVYALFTPDITVTANGTNGYGSATYSYKKPNGSNNTAADQYIARSSDSSKWYKNLNDAFSAESTVVLCANTTFAGDFALPSDKTLSVPCSSSDTATTELRAANSTTGPSPYITATFNDSLTVNGNLIASGRQSSNQSGNGSVTGAAGFISFKGEVTVENGGVIYAYGVINDTQQGKGTGTINVKSGGIVYELMEIRDMRNIYGLIDHATNSEVFPMNCFYFHTNLVKTSYQQGARMYGLYYVNINQQTSSGTIPVIGAAGTSNALFKLSEGSITKSYDPNEKKYKFTIDSSSTVQTGSFTVTVTINMGSPQTIDLDTSKYVLPLSAGYWIDVADSAAFKINSDLKLLPGAKLTVQKGGTLNIALGKKLVLYRANDYDYRSKGTTTSNDNQKQGFTVNGYPKWFSYPTGVSTTAANLGSAKLIVDGTINCQGGLYVTNQLSSTQTYNPYDGTSYANGYNYLTGTGKIIMSSTPSDPSITEQIERTNNDNTDTGAASTVTVAITAVKGITDYSTATDNGQTDYNSLTKGTWYGMINESGVNVWATSRAILSYDANGGGIAVGNAAPDPVAKPVGEDYTFTAAAADTFTAPANTNKVFTGWNTEANGSGTSYAAGDTFTISEDTTLYAQWEVPTYTVTWVIDGVSTEETYELGAAPTHADPTKEKDSDYSYTFAGWSTDGVTVLNSLPNVTADATYIAVFTAKSLEPQHSLTLDGEIGVNFYIPKDVVDDQINSTVKMSWGPEDNTDPNHGEATFAIKDLTDNNNNNTNVAFHKQIDEGSSTKNPLAKAKINGDYYQFTAFVAAKQMADEVTVTIYDGVKETTDTYRVADYCYEVIKNEKDADGKTVYDRMHAKRPEIDEGKFTKLQELCKAMLTYGAKAQDQFGYNNNAESYADKDLANYTYQYTCTADTFSEFYSTTYASGAGDMTYYGSSMQLEAETTYTVWLRYTNAGYKLPTATATVKKKEVPVAEVPVDKVEVGKYGDYYYVRYNILNLPANLLTESITVQYNNDVSATYNAKTYFYIAMVSGNDTLKNTIASLYNYNQAAVQYFG